jgi:xylulokinase
MTVDRLVAAVRAAIGELGAGPLGRVAAVGIAGIAESGAPLGRDGRAQAPIIAWNDPRGGEVVDRLHRRFGAELERWIGQRLRAVSSVAKLGWLVDRGAGPVSRWLGVPELALHALTGVQATEFSLAARTGAYHIGDRRYVPEVVQTLGLGIEVFPPVLAAGCPMGQVSPAAATWSGLPAGVPVTLGGHDHLAGRAGAGVRHTDLANSVGTAETVLAGDQPWPDVDRALSLRVAVTLMPGGKKWALLASAARAGIVRAAVADVLGGSAEELDRHARGGARIALSDAAIEAAAHGEPFELPQGPQEAVWNGVLDGLAARTWEAVDRLRQTVSAPRPATAEGSGGPTATSGLVVFGGGSRSRPWLEAKAAARPATPVWRSGAQEAVARGAALWAGVAAGWWPSPEAGPQVPRERVIPPVLRR